MISGLATALRLADLGCIPFDQELRRRDVERGSDLSDEIDRSCFSAVNHVIEVRHRDACELGECGNRPALQHRQDVVAQRLPQAGLSVHALDRRPFRYCVFPLSRNMIANAGSLAATCLLVEAI